MVVCLCVNKHSVFLNLPSAPMKTFHRLCKRVLQICFILWLHSILKPSNQMDPPIMQNINKVPNKEFSNLLGQGFTLNFFLSYECSRGGGKNTDQAEQATKLSKTVFRTVKAIPI